MRTFKFRAWIYREKIMCCVERLYIPMNTNTIGASNEIRTIGLNHQNFDKDIELMQYTGESDKNGKEIYEGDIVLSFMNTKHVILFNKGRFEAFGYYDSGADDPTDIFESHDLCGGIEVIGNIYENPELIE